MNKDELQESLFTRGFRKNLIFVGVFALCISAMFASGYLVKKANAATTDSMMVYDTQTITTTPKYRLWNGSSWDSEASATPISGDIAHMEVKYAPTRDEAIMIIQSTTGEISAQVFNGSSWGSKTVLGTITGNGLGPDQQALNGRCFDIFYEQTSGDAIVVYCDNTADPDYQVWNGTSWTGSGINIDIPTTGLVNAIEVANRVGSEEGAFIIVDANSDVYGMRWTGSAWSNMGTATTWETTASLATKKPIDVAFERTSGDIMFSWGFATAATAHFRYRTYTQSNSTLNAVTNVTNANNGGVVHWLQLAPDPATSSDKIMIGLLDAGSDLNTFEWSGTAWSAVHTEHSGGTEDFVDMNFDLVYETHSSHASDVWLTFGDSATVTRKKWDAGAWGTSTTTGDDTAFTAMVAQPNSGAVLAVAYEDNTSATDDIRSFQITGGGTTWSGNTTIWAGPVARNLGFTRVDLAGQAYSSSTEAIMVYDNEDMVTTPKFRVWDGTAWGSEQTANNVNGDTFFMTIKFAPTRDEAILVTYGSTGDISSSLEWYVMGKPNFDWK